jgi:hypothetical protein
VGAYRVIGIIETSQGRDNWNCFLAGSPTLRGAYCTNGSDRDRLDIVVPSRRSPKVGFWELSRGQDQQL